MTDAKEINEYIRTVARTCVDSRTGCIDWAMVKQEVIARFPHEHKDLYEKEVKPKLFPSFVNTRLCAIRNADHRRFETLVSRLVIGEA